MKKLTIILIVIPIIILLCILVPKPYFLSPGIKSCEGSKIINLGYFYKDSGWCVGVIYPINIEKKLENPYCTMQTKGWDCIGYKFYKKSSIIL